MSVLFRLWSAFLTWRESRRDAGPRPGEDQQWREWLALDYAGDARHAVVVQVRDGGEWKPVTGVRTAAFDWPCACNKSTSDCTKREDGTCA